MTRFLAWLCALLLPAVPFALADDGKDEKERDEERRLELDVDDFKATIKLERELDGLEDAVKIEYDAGKAKLQVKHEAKNETTESEEKLEARFLALVEYADGNGNGAYDAGEPVASAWALGDDEKDAKIPINGTVEWGEIAVADAAGGNAPGKKLSSRASFGENATFGLDFHVYGDFTLVGNRSLAPTEAKIDILIQRYPYAQDGTALAVLVDLKAKEEFKDEREDDGEEGVSSEGVDGNLTFRLTFTWLENATVDGADREVRSTVIKSKEEAKDGEIEQKARVALSYPRGDFILHDPTVGVTYGAQGSGARPVPMGLGVLAAVGLAALAARRRE
ncbi:MAG TPA: hypothetical protein VHH36_08430 [Candidatus Thermoplasmatota archaeon]|nr:hypothetical protein [Candidatus Thermoplasmatota archaeon]